MPDPYQPDRRRRNRRGEVVTSRWGWVAIAVLAVIAVVLTLLALLR